jgi:hypothetical protein
MFVVAVTLVSISRASHFVVGNGASHDKQHLKLLDNGLAVCLRDGPDPFRDS